MWPRVRAEKHLSRENGCAFLQFALDVCCRWKVVVIEDDEVVRRGSRFGSGGEVGLRMSAFFGFLIWDFFDFIFLECNF